MIYNWKYLVFMIWEGAVLSQQGAAAGCMSPCPQPMAYPCGGSCKPYIIVACVAWNLCSLHSPTMASQAGRDIMKSEVRGSIVAFIPWKGKKGEYMVFIMFKNL